MWLATPATRISTGYHPEKAGAPPSSPGTGRQTGAHLEYSMVAGRPPILAVTGLMAGEGRVFSARHSSGDLRAYSSEAGHIHGQCAACRSGLKGPSADIVAAHKPAIDRVGEQFSELARIDVGSREPDLAAVGARAR